jgi:molybdenum cofactor biosynthesis enzyme MoaA
VKEIKPEDSKYRIVYLDIVHRCNMECANCYLPNRDFADLKTNKIIDFISRFKQPTEFRFIGGEPTLHKDLHFIIKQVNEMPIRHRTTLVTNGLRLSSNDYVKRLKEAGLKTVYISMTGYDDNEVYKITDRLSCANKKIVALENIIKNKLRLAIGCIVVKGLNEHVIDRIKNRLNQKDIRVGASVEKCRSSRTLYAW